MFLFYYNNHKVEYERIVGYLHKSCYVSKNNLFLETRNFHRNTRLNHAADLIVFAGMIRGDGNIYKWCKYNSKRFFYIDHAYLNRGYKVADLKNEWLRVTDSDFCWNKFEKKSHVRWLDFFADKYEPMFKPWLSNFDRPNILVLPPSRATQFLYPESQIWLQKTLIELNKIKDRQIVIREKPIQQRIDSNNNVLGVLKYKHQKTIEEELEDACLVVTFNSAVAVAATIVGIPVITDQTAAAAPISVGYDNFINPPEPNRKEWLYQLVHHQFTSHEMSDGTFWKMMFEGKE